jgi:hypothetical protein
MKAKYVLWAAGLTTIIPAALAQTLTPEVKAKVEAKAAQLKTWSADSTIVSAVRAANAGPQAEAKGMTNEQWKKLTLLDPIVRSFTRNPLGQYLKTKKDDQISECFVSDASGAKVAFLTKTTSWSHADKDKHKVPMTGKTWFGPAEMDESTGELQVQVGLPVLDGAKPIGSIIVGLSVAKLK